MAEGVHTGNQGPSNHMCSQRREWGQQRGTGRDSKGQNGREVEVGSHDEQSGSGEQQRGQAEWDGQPEES